MLCNRLNFNPKIFVTNIARVKNPIPRRYDRPSLPTILCFGAIKSVSGNPILTDINNINSIACIIFLVNHTDILYFWDHIQNH